MNRRNVSISLLLTLALGLTACGGGGNTSTLEESGDRVVDTTSPVFVDAANIKTSYKMEEGTTSLAIATLKATDNSVISFTLEGADAEYFKVDTTKTGSVYSAVLKFKNTPDYEEQSDYAVRVVAADTQGNKSSKNFTIALTDKPFTFDVTGNMGSVVFNESKTLSLSTKEAKNTVTYTLSGNSYFTLNNNSVDFNAPDFNTTIGADNSYTATVVAYDGNKTISLNVSATVIQDPDAPAVKTYLLKSKRVLEPMSMYYDYEYVYDTDNYLVKVDKKRDNKVESSVSYEYSSDHLIMRGKIGETVDSIRVFENKKTTQNKFAVNINQNRLSSYEYENYMSEIYDTLSYKNNIHMTKYIKGLSASQTLAELYVYNNDDSLRRVLMGNYTIDSEAILALSDEDLKSASLASFPAASDRLSDVQLNTLNSGTMPFQLNGETTYQYDSKEAISIKGIDYLRNDGGTLTKVDIHNFTTGIEYYGTNVIHTINSHVNKDVIVNYNLDSELQSVVNDGVEYTYGFTKDGKKMTITAVHKSTSTIVATYNFEEE